MMTNARGWADTRVRVQDILKADEFLTSLVSRNLGSPTFHEWETATLSAAMTIFCHARYLAHQLPARPSDYINSLVIGELMAPQLPMNVSLSRGAAEKEFIFVMVYLKTNETIYTRGKTFTVFRTVLTDANVGILPADIIPVPNLESSSLHDMVIYLEWLTSNLNVNQYMSPINLLVTTYVSVAKRGTVSDRFVDKVINGIQDDIGIEVNLDVDTLHRVYTNFGRYVDETNAEDVFRAWLGDIPEHALRLRLTLGQVSGSGLTAYIVVGRALYKYRDFPWMTLNTLTSNEVQSFITATGVVNGNMYYGFRKELGAVKSTNYSSVAFVAKELLIRLNGDISLKHYQGWIKKPKNPIGVMALIDRYVGAKEAELNEMADNLEVADDNRDFINVVTSAVHADMFV